VSYASGVDSGDDPYDVLGVGAWADAHEVRRAWRKLALRWHPDRAGPESKGTFQRILAAYTVLSDPLARAAHDRKRGTPPRPPAAPEPPRRRAPDAMLRRLSGWIQTLLAGGVARHAEDGAIELFLTPEEVDTGGIVRISMRVPIRNPDGSSDPVEELFSAWFNVPPGVTEGTRLDPSVSLPSMLHPVSFRIRFRR